MSRYKAEFSSAVINNFCGRFSRSQINERTRKKDKTNCSYETQAEAFADYKIEEGLVT
jgi:hypothetical protein